MLASASAALIGSIFLAASAFAGTVSSTRSFVPRGAYLAATESGRLLVLSPQGKLLRRGPQFGGFVQALALSPDRRSAYVSGALADQPPQLYEVALGSGERVLIANAISPALSPDGTELAYLTVTMQNDSKYITALVIRDLRTGSPRTIPFPPGVPLGTPPELIINWSPHGHSIALFDGTQTRIVNVASAQTVVSQPALPGGGRASAPVYLDPDTLVVLPNCCQSPQPLVAIKVHSGVQAPFAKVGNPIENVRRLKRRTLLATTAVHRLIRITQGHKARAVTKRTIVAIAP